MNSKNVLKSVLAFALLLCLLKMPYYYYQLIRVCGMVGFFYFAYADNKDKIKITPQLFFIAALIINPIIKVPLRRNTWQLVDVVFAFILLLSMYWDNLQSNKVLGNESPNGRIYNEEEILKAEERIRKRLEELKK
jgi:hypothetical protein